MIKVIDTWRYFLKQFASSMAKKFMIPHGYFEAYIAVLRIDWEIICRDKWYLLIWCLGTYDIAKRDILETFRLTDIIKVRNVDTTYVSSGSHVETL
jgi:hypothetical protein